MIRPSDFENALATLEELRVKASAAPGQMRDEAFHQVRETLIAAQQHCAPVPPMTDAPRQDAPDARDDSALIVAILESHITHAGDCAHREPNGRDTPNDCDCNRRDLLKLVHEWREMASRLRERVPSEPSKWDGWLPTSENINALPEPLRKFIHHLEASCDPAGTLRELVLVRDENANLRALAPHAPEPVAYLHEHRTAEGELFGQDLHFADNPDRPKRGGIPLYRDTPPQRAGDDDDAMDLIAERDKLEDDFDRAYVMVVGEQPEWSNLFGREEALDRMGEVLHAQRAGVTEEALAVFEKNGWELEAFTWQDPADEWQTEWRIIQHHIPFGPRVIVGKGDTPNVALAAALASRVAPHGGET